MFIRSMILRELRKYVRLIISLDILIKNEVSDDSDAEAKLFKTMVKEGAYGKDYEKLHDSFKDTVLRMHNYELSNLFPETTWSGIFLSIYSFAEFALSLICEYHSNISNKKIQLKDLKGLGVNRSKIYLHKVAGISIFSKSTEWKNITIYNKIRNAISHNGGYLDEGKVRIIKQNYSDKHLIINTKYGNYILLTKEFVLEVQYEFDKFFNLLFNELKK